MRCGFVAGCPKSASSSPLPDFGRALLFFRGLDEGQVALIVLFFLLSVVYGSNLLGEGV